jgi:lysophospholipid acyltransferase (LPLAT)-like uncharacterized protein
MLSWKRIARSRQVQQTLGTLISYYLRLVWKTNRVTIEPADFYSRITPELPIIVAMWHGQHFMVPFFRRPEHKVKVLISRHRDGEVNAIAAEHLGVGIIRGSGDHGGRYDRKGGVAAFKGMIDALKAGYNMALTADVPKVSRKAGNGIVMLARYSGRPIYPVAVATSRRVELDNWDRSAVNMPFGKFAIVVGDPVTVASDADDAAIEAARRAVEDGLNTVTARAYAIVDGGRAGGGADGAPRHG